MKKILISILLVVAYLLQTYPQGTLTPNAYGYAQYAATPVNYYNGLPQIVVPVATMQDNGCTVPISLSYHASGIKVEQQASMVGLGWHLNVGGSITKVTLGKVDKECHYYVHNSTNIYDFGYTEFFWGWPTPGVYTPLDINPNYINTRNQCSEEETLYAALFNGKNMPDVYYFNFYGISGQFVIDYRTNTPVIFSKNSDTKFEPLNNDYFESNGWKAITMDGSIFKFETVETRVMESSDPGEYESKTFYLTSIQFPNGEKVIFSYINGSQVTSVYSYSRVETLNIDNDIETFDEVKVKSTYTPKYLAEITTSTQKVVTEFSYSARGDINGEKKLDEIMIQDNITNEKQYFDFSYDYFTEGEIGDSYLSAAEQYEYTPDELSKRLKLVSFGQRNLPKYDFTYNSTQLPDKTSHARDYWGYYNGQNSTTLTPDIYRLAKFDEFYKDVPTFTASMSHRGANETYMKAGMLTSVKSPLGGVTEYEYEAHTFDNFYYEAIGENWTLPGTSTGGGLRIKKIVKKDRTGGNIVSEQNFNYEETYESYGRLMVRLKFISRYYNNGDRYWSIVTNNNVTFSEHAQGSQVGYDRVTVYNYENGNMGKSVYNYHNNVNYIMDDLDRYDLYTVNLPTFPDKSNGLLSSEKHYNAELNPKSEITYSYNITGSSEILGAVGSQSGTLFSTIIYYPAESWQINPSTVIKKIYDDNGTTSTSRSDYTYNDVGQLIEIKESDVQPGMDLITEFVYPYDSNPTAVEDYMVADHSYNNLLKKTVKLGNEILSEDEITYNNISYNGKRIYYPYIVQSARGTDVSEVTNNVNSKGQINESTNSKTGITTAFIRAYDNSHVVSAVTGTDYYTAVSYMNDISNETSAATIRAEVDKIRTNMPGCRVSTITYDSFARKESETNANGKTIYYKYDSMGRLFRIVDHYGNVLQEMQYNVVKQ